MSTDANSGPGWYEVIHPTTATTEIVRVMEDGSIYCPEGVVTRGEFLYAAARGNAHRLVRADDPGVRAGVVTEEPEWEYVPGWIADDGRARISQGVIAPGHVAEFIAEGGEVVRRRVSRFETVTADMVPVEQGDGDV